MRSANPSSLPAEGRPDDSLNARLRDWLAGDPDHLVGASTACDRFARIAEASIHLPSTAPLLLAASADFPDFRWNFLTLLAIECLATRAETRFRNTLRQRTQRKGRWCATDSAAPGTPTQGKSD